MGGCHMEVPCNWLNKLIKLAFVYEFLYKFFNKVAILGPACGGPQGIRPFTLLVRLVELALAIGILITFLLQSCKFGVCVWGGTGRVDFIRRPKLKAILPYLCISTTCRPGIVLVQLATLVKTMFCVCVPPALFSHFWAWSGWVGGLGWVTRLQRCCSR